MNRCSRPRKGFGLREALLKRSENITVVGWRKLMKQIHLEKSGSLLVLEDQIYKKKQKVG